MQIFLYSLFIAPLENAMRYILLLAFSCTDSWGLSLVLMSLAVNTILIPIYHLAEGWQEDERRLQRQMAPKLAEIRAVYFGREKDMFVRALYRHYKYNPLLAMRTSLGLLIQIPFFFAAYHLLNSAPELSGQSFMFISDLSLPDALLPLGKLDKFSINLLPFLMTGINLLSAAVYTVRLSKRDKIQLYGLSALFLILLYTASSALLIYWTCNNIFSFFKNLIYSHYIYNDTKAQSPKALAAFAKLFCKVGSRLRNIGNRLPHWLDILLSLMAIALFMYAEKRLAYSYNLGVMGAALCVALSAALLRINNLRRLSEKISAELPYFFCWLAALVATAIFVLTAPKKLVNTQMLLYATEYSVTMGIFIVWILSRQPLLTLCVRMADFCHRRIKPAQITPAFFAGTSLIMVLIFIYSPASLFTSDPDFFYEPLGALAGNLIFRALVFLGICLFFMQHAPAKIRPFISAFALWGGLVVFLYTFVATGNYGLMDDVFFQDLSMLYSRLAPAVDLAVSAVALTLVWFFLRNNKTGALTGVFQGLSLVLAGLASIQLVLCPLPDNIPSDAASTRLPEYSQRLFSFNPQGKNSIIFMFDAFTGGHVQKIFTDDPELATAFDGFTWYPDTLAPGASTILSISALLGGENFLPSEINKRNERPLLEAIHEGFSVLPNQFVPRDYDVSLAAVDSLQADLLSPYCPYMSDILLVGPSVNSAYVGYWRNKRGIPGISLSSQAPFLASFGTFQGAPWTIRRHIYGFGNWMKTQSNTLNVAEGSTALMDILPELSNTKQNRNTIKYIASMMVHHPWRINAETCLPFEETDGSRDVNAHIASERCALLAIARWLDWLKENNVYDNTQIILVSDHSEGDSQYTNGADFEDLRGDPDLSWKPHALLLVKNFNERGKLRIDNRPMMSSDIISLICRENGGCPELDYTDPLLASEKEALLRKRIYSLGLHSIRRQDKTKFRIKPYTVTGSMFERKNWKNMENEKNK